MFPKLTSVTTGFFDRTTAATTFNSTLQDCKILTYVPEGLFAKDTTAVNCSATFRYCTKLQLNPNIFCNEATEKATRFAGKTMTFTNCFNLGTSTFTGTQGTAPALWDYTMNSASVKTTCFTGQTATSLTNFASIPSAWK